MIRLAFLLTANPSGPAVRVWRYTADQATEVLYQIWCEPAPLANRLVSMDSVDAPDTRLIPGKVSHGNSSSEIA